MRQITRHSGARLGASYDVQFHIGESMSPGVIAARWIPGLRLSAHPGMTKNSLKGSNKPANYDVMQKTEENVRE
jgi:hypothetical protein